jgi:L-threonylcarbamoyladenylate synthase
MERQHNVQQACDTLGRGGVILYPTDTIWGIGCDATNEAAIEKVFEIKNRPKEKSLILLADSLEMVKQYVPVTPGMEAIIGSFEIPTTVIYDAPFGLPSAVISEVNTVAIRITEHAFCRALIHCFGRPIISTSANISGEKPAAYFEEISQSIVRAVDFIVSKEYDTSQYKQPSRLLKIRLDNTIDQLR